MGVLHPGQGVLCGCVHARTDVGISPGGACLCTQEPGGGFVPPVPSMSPSLLRMELHAGVAGVAG